LVRSVEFLQTAFPAGYWRADTRLDVKAFNTTSEPASVSDALSRKLMERLIWYAATAAIVGAAAALSGQSEISDTSPASRECVRSESGISFALGVHDRRGAQLEFRNFKASRQDKDKSQRRADG
jgi:hypothetical protein